VHVLTKIFVVLVSLLTVLLVPLVVVYSYNEDTFKQKYVDSQAMVDTLRTKVTEMAARHGAEMQRRDNENDTLSSRIRELRTQNSRLEAEVQDLSSQLATAEAFEAELNSKLATLTSAVETTQELNASLVDEVRTLRQRALSSEREQAELDEQLRAVSSQLEVAIKARRQLEEEVQRLTEQQARALDKVRQYVAVFGALSEREVRNDMVPPDRNLTTTVIRVEESAGRTLVELDAGSRDGIKKDWGMFISHNGNFIGSVRIIEVDVNHSVGVVELMNPSAGTDVKVGYQAHALRGRT